MKIPRQSSEKFRANLLIVMGGAIITAMWIVYIVFGLMLAYYSSFLLFLAIAISVLTILAILLFYPLPRKRSKSRKKKTK